MATSLKAINVARKALTYLGKSKAEIKIREHSFASELQSVISGKPRKEKEAFLKLYETFLRHPENQELQVQIKNAIKSSKKVEQSAIRGRNREIEHLCQQKNNTPMPEYVPTETDRLLDELCGQAENKVGAYQFEFDNNVAIRAQTESVFGEMFYNIHKESAILSKELRLIHPIQTRSTFLNALSEAKTKIPREINLPSCELIKPEELSKIATEVIKEINKERRIFVGRALMYPVNKLISRFIPKEIKELLSDIIKLPQEKFGQSFYERLTSTKNIVERAPQGYTVTKTSAKPTLTEMLTGKKSKYNCQGGFDSVTNTMEFTKEFNSLPKWLQANLITHELKHFEQIDTVIRTYGIKRYLDATRISLLKQISLKPENATKTEKELKQMVDKIWNDECMEEKIKTAFASSTKAERIPVDSELGKQAEIYLNAHENYTGIGDGFMLDVPKEYKKNPLEVEAYKNGNRMGWIAMVLQNLQFKTI